MTMTALTRKEPSRVDVEDLVSNYPRLFHMTAAGAWPSIAAHGLLPTRDIVATSGLPDAERALIVDQQRRRPVRLDHPVLGDVTIRDQSPLRRHILEAVLVDMTVREWLAALNERVYFWLHPRRLAALVRSRPNRRSEHDILTVDTASLVAAHHDQIRLSAINSGATQWPSAPQRGPGTFLPIEQYSFTERRRTRTLDHAIAELAVIGGVPDIAAHVVAVQRRHGGTLLSASARAPTGRRETRGVPDGRPLAAATLLLPCPAGTASPPATPRTPARRRKVHDARACSGDARVTSAYQLKQ